MFVIEVVPLIRGTQLDTLSYYSSTPYEIGTFLSVPIRNKEKPAIVTAIHSVAESKSSLKTAAFALKKLPPQTDTACVPENTRLTANALTKIYPSSVGSTLYQLLPPEVRQGLYRYPNISTLKHGEESTPRVLTARQSERYINYRSHIRSVLARRGSVLFVVPTSVDVEYAYHELAAGIEDRIVTFSPTQGVKERKLAYAAFEDTALAKVIITTPSHAYLDRVDLLSIIVEGEASELYRDRERPYIDHRTALILHAKLTGRSILLGDILPRPETEHKRRQDIFSTEGEETKRLSFSAPCTVIEQIDRPTSERPFTLFSKELLTRIKSTLSGRGRVFLYGARRGIAPVVACIDCGHIFRCPDSGTPYSLLRTHGKNGEEERWFVSSTSGKRVRAADTCTTCGSWRLRERGIGIQTVHDECQTLFPETKIMLFDRETVTTKKRAEAVMKEFYEERSAILIGTQIALPPLMSRGVDLSAVVSLDATRANPTWRADEQTLRLLLTLRDLSHKEVIVQTRTATDDLLRSAHTGMIEGFYTEELSLRESLAYPPFSTFILLSWQGSLEAVRKTETEVLKRTVEFVSTCYSHPHSNENKTLRHALFRIQHDQHKLSELIEILRQFPPYIKIECDPSRIV
jgi:primosomal protein N'